MHKKKIGRLDFDENWPAPKEYLYEVGRMTVVWGTLESSVNLAISKLAGYETPLDFRAVILVAHSNFQQRVNIISTLCEQLAPEYPSLRGYKKVISKIEAAQKGRNKYAHNAIFLNEETGKVNVSYASARGPLKTSVEIVHINDIKEVSAKIHEAMCALQSLVTGHQLSPMWERHA